ncbi:MAG: hypothetical protein ABMB14_13665 [Myxococcota bacterium]
MTETSATSDGSTSVQVVARWTPAPGYTLGPVLLVGDIDGDGYVDAAIGADPTVDDGEGGSDTSILRGPLRQARVVPRDEAIHVDDAAIDLASDIDGDGLVDLHLATPDGRWVRGPLPDRIDAAAGERWDGWFVDVDQDGFLDRLTAPDPTTIGVVLGPAARWGEPADLVIVAPCAPEGGWDLRSDPDLTGDRRPDVFLVDYDASCGPFAFPVPDPGGVVHLLREIVPAYRALPDQTGDGLWDVLTAFDDDPRLVLVPGPVTIRDGWIGPAPPPAARVHLPDLRPLGADLDGDGYHELFDPADWRVWFGRADRLAVPDLGPHVGGTESPAGFAEDGVWATLIPSRFGSLVDVVDVAPLP